MSCKVSREAREPRAANRQPQFDGLPLAPPALCAGPPAVGRGGQVARFVCLLLLLGLHALHITNYHNMESEVQSSSSLYSTYIATVDHLPCDIVRSLWIVQMCNLSLEKEMNQVHKLLQYKHWNDRENSLEDEEEINTDKTAESQNGPNTEKELESQNGSESQQGPDAEAHSAGDLLPNADESESPGANLATDSYNEENLLAKDYYEKQTQIMRWHDESVAELDSLCTQLADHEKTLLQDIAELQKIAEGPVVKDPESMLHLRHQLQAHYRENPLHSQVEVQQERILQNQSRVVIQRKPGREIKIIFKLHPEGRPGRAETRTVRTLSERVGGRRHSDRLSQRENDRMSEKSIGSGLVRGRRSERRRERIDRTSERSDRISDRISRRTSEKFSDRVSRVRTAATAEARNGPRTLRSRDSGLGVPVRNTQSGRIAKPHKKRGRKPKKEVRQKAAPIPEPKVENEDSEVYCFCKQRSFGDMIACDNAKCPNGEWFHYKCVGLLNRVEALRYKTEKWYCSDGCREAGSKVGKKRGRKKKKRRGNK